MKYREFGKTGLKVSALGFGTMRLPLLEDGVTVDEKEAVRIIRHAIDSGVNYVDTAYPYHQGTSEIVVGKALGDGYRDKVFLADKSPIWKLEKESDFDSILEEQLQKLQTDHIDFYLLHALNKERFEKIKNLHLIDHMLEARKAGKIRYLGFSFHDDLEVFKQIVDYTDQWDFCQIQYNYIDTQVQAGDKGYELAAKMGVPMVIMEPVKGGRLANLPEEAKEALNEADPDRSAASWALRWVGSHENVKVILSGMSSMEQLEDNLETFGKFQPLTEAEEEAVEKAADLIRSRVKNGCTSCRYCMPCPFGVNIPEMFSIWNNCAMFDEEEKAKKAYAEQKVQDASADLCKKCGACEKACPQGLSIRADLEKVAKELNTEEA